MKLRDNRFVLRSVLPTLVLNFSSLQGPRTFLVAMAIAIVCVCSCACMPVCTFPPVNFFKLILLSMFKVYSKMLWDENPW